ncbi:MAG: hypothetical protein AAF382_18680 [Pseudomonadota bacterium]
MHKLIAIWSHPRSMSTALERLMRERGDLTCLHEPFMYHYYIGERRGAFPGFDVDAGHPTEYAAIRDMLVARAEAGPVCFKDMPYYVMPRMAEDPAFLRRVTHAFLIRHPMAAILSYHKLDPDVSLHEIGLETQWQLYEAVRAAGLPAVVVEAETVRTDPRATMKAFWGALGLEWRAEAFDWGRPPEDWDGVSAWHEAASTSSGIRSADAEEMVRVEMEFEAAVADGAGHLRDYLDHHWPFYARMSEVALRI